MVPSATASMSDYQVLDEYYDYEAKPLSFGRAIQRAQALSLNSRGVQPNLQPDIPGVNSTAFCDPHRYPPYGLSSLGYNPGAERVALPQAQANPAPVLDQVHFTSSHLYESAFSGADLPPILFQFEPIRDDLSDIKVPLLCESETGQPVLTSRGATLRYFSFLPRYIAWGVSEALLEFWFRLDYRLEMNDILMRIESGDGVWNHLNPDGARNALRMKRARSREDYLDTNNWGDSRRYPMESDIKILGKLSPLQICLNTTMIVDWKHQRLLKPVFRDEYCKKRIGYLDSRLPMDYFLQSVITTVPSKKTIAAIALRWGMQDLAIVRGRGDLAESWDNLDREDRPAWWTDKQNGPRPGVGKAIEIFHNQSWLEWMQRELGDQAQAGIRTHMKTRGWVV